MTSKEKTTMMVAVGRTGDLERSMRPILSGTALGVPLNDGGKPT
jgi:hypothetical protein